ncbi:MAG: hypothetical protein RL368_1374 [Pseudomonadota bacterium]
MRMRLLLRGLIVLLLCGLSSACAVIKSASDLEFFETDKGTVLTIGEVFFEFDKANLLPLAERKMDRLAEIIQTYQTRKVLITGHADALGETAYNQNLSERRAHTVLNALVKRGVSASRLKAQGVGESRPIASNTNAEGRQQNRRVEMLILNEGLGFND